MMNLLLSAQYNVINLENPFVNLDLVVWCLFAGIVIAGIASVFTKRVIGNYVRALIKAQAGSPETAKTLSELGYAGNHDIRASLRSENGALRRFVKIADSEDTAARISADGKRKIDFENDKFYIPEELWMRAEIRYEKWGTDVFSLIFTVILALAAVFFMKWAVPQIMGLLDEFLGSIRSADDSYIRAGFDFLTQL